MAKTTYTNATATVKAFELLKELGCDDAELMAKLGHMAEVAAKPKATAKYADTAAGREAMKRAKAVAAFISQAGRPVPTCELAENLDGFIGSDGTTSWQRVSRACSKAAKDLGTIEKCPDKIKVGSQMWTAYQPKGYKAGEK